MWVSVLKKRVRFRIGMGFEPAQVSARDGFRSERVQFKLSFGPRRLSARHMFWIGTGRFGSGFGPTRVSALDGFSDHNGFWADTSFRTR
ncbi:hypothetical protein HanRHA438_Chr14g0678521 [Helianthus annuus]|nr:hypothetical protein HanRHA438_Chr14g0678521 [Helianthus annuus]